MDLNIDMTNVVLPKERPSLDLGSIPTWFYFRVHTPSGHVYIEQFSRFHGVMDIHKSASPTPSAVEKQRLQALLNQWGREGEGTWSYRLCTLLDLMQMQRIWDEAQAPTAEIHPET